MAIRPVKELPVLKSGRAANESFVEADMREFAVPHMDGGYCAWGIRKEQR